MWKLASGVGKVLETSRWGERSLLRARPSRRKKKNEKRSPRIRPGKKRLEHKELLLGAVLKREDGSKEREETTGFRREKNRTKKRLSNKGQASLTKKFTRRKKGEKSEEKNNNRSGGKKWQVCSRLQVAISRT